MTARVTAPMPRLLLGILLCRANAPVSVDVLVDALWAGRVASGAHKRLQLHVHRLRRALGDPDRIRFEQSGYLLWVRPGELDADRFEALLDESSDAVSRGEPDRAAALLREALGLWRGEPYGEWADVPLLRAEAERLAERRVTGLEELYVAELACKRHVAIVPELAHLAAQHPLRERLQGLLMTALSQAGRQAEALTVYRGTRQALVDELGVEPGPELRRLHQAILVGQDTGTPPCQLPVPKQLPADIADFTGRAEPVALLRELLAPVQAPTAVAVSAVAGKAGVGKTTLAVHVAHQLQAQFPDGQLYVNLRGAQQLPVAPAVALGQFLRALGVDGAVLPHDLEERAAMYRSRLADRRALVLLDDAASAAQVRPLLPGTPRCAVLVTSRARLTGLAGAGLVNLDILDPCQAVSLLARITGSQRVSTEPNAAEEIVRLCGYLPLAVRIAGARLAARPHWRLAHLAGLLADERRRLDELQLGDLAVRASLTLGYAALESTAQRTLRLLCLLDAPDVASWAAAALLDAPVAAAELAIEQLLDAQLLESAGQDVTGQQRYRFHDLVRVYARERAYDEEPEADRLAALEQALGTWLALAEQANRSLQFKAFQPTRANTPRPYVSLPMSATLLADPLTWFDAEQAALVAAVEQAARGGMADLAWELANVQHPFLRVRGRTDDWQHTHTIALDAARDSGARLGEAVVLSNLGVLHIVQDRHGDALSCFEQALVRFREVSEPRGEANAQLGLGDVFRWLTRYEEALRSYESAAHTFRLLRDRPREAGALLAIGAAHLEHGSYDDAESQLGCALALFRDVSYRHGEARTLMRMGALCRAQRRLHDAASRLSECLAILNEVDERQLEAYALHELANVYADQHRPSQAMTMLERCTTVFRELGDRHGEALTRRSMGELHGALSHPEDALECLTRSLQIWSELQRPLWWARAQRSLGNLHALYGDHDAARGAWQKALVIFTKVGVPDADDLALTMATGRTHSAR
ncbi:MAG: BTAD domain-containing putative transcriptional regulator [Carbonactinosporaceae bacterium]